MPEEPKSTVTAEQFASMTQFARWTHEWNRTREFFKWLGENKPEGFAALRRVYLKDVPWCEDARISRSVIEFLDKEQQQ